MEKFESIEIHTSGASHYPKEKRLPEWYCFEYQTTDDGKDSVIRDFVGVNNEGSLMANRDILADAIKLGFSKTRKDEILESDLYDLYKNVIWH